MKLRMGECFIRVGECLSIQHVEIGRLGSYRSRVTVGGGETAFFL